MTVKVDKTHLESCLICRQAKEEEHAVNYRQGLFFFETKHFRLRHSDETRIHGYLILESKRHFLDLSEAEAEEIQEFGPILAQAIKAVRRFSHPQRVYTFTLAEAVPHFHVHIIPREENLPKRFVGRGIMSYPTKPGLSRADRDEICGTLKRFFV